MGRTEIQNSRSNESYLADKYLTCLQPKEAEEELREENGAKSVLDSGNAFKPLTSHEGSAQSFVQLLAGVSTDCAVTC